MRGIGYGGVYFINSRPPFAPPFHVGRPTVHILSTTISEMCSGCVINVVRSNFNRFKIRLRGPGPRSMIIFVL